ncbi:hypothetical protein SALBM217S_04952 [Streptomyces griseoloalbus]
MTVTPSGASATSNSGRGYGMSRSAAGKCSARSGSPPAGSWASATRNSSGPTGTSSAGTSTSATVRASAAHRGSATASTRPSTAVRRSRRTVRHSSAAWFTAATTSRRPPPLPALASPSPSVRTVSSRSAYSRRSSWYSGFSRPSPSIADQEVTGQQSLSCHTTLPAHTGQCERQCSIPAATARTWFSCVR